MIPYSNNTNPTFENFIATCPQENCGFENIFNRATDLKTFRFITFKEVSCEGCGNKFNINCDQACNVYEYLIYDCYELLKMKKYMYVILNCSQSFEAFFFLYLRNKYLYQPSDKEIVEFDQFNYLSECLSEHISKLPFGNLRSLFLWSHLKGTPLKYYDLMKAIESLSNKSYRKPPSDEKIFKLTNANISEVLIKIKDFEINTIRNMVVHKGAYRPTLEEAELYLNKTRELIFGYRRISKFQPKTFSLSPM